jgi:ribosomal protein S18 acetylase RimI-like enzyme
MITVRKTKFSDQTKIFEMYKKAAKYVDGLARNEKEITLEYVADFLSHVEKLGLSFVAVDNEVIVGEIHCYRINLECFAHMLSNLTIAVDPDFHSKGVGRKLFNRLIDEVLANHTHITRIELASRETNQKAIDFYSSLGFKIEGRFEGRVKNHDGTLVADIPMAWHRKDHEELTQ